MELDDILVIVLAGGAGERLYPADQGARQAGGLLRRAVPHHRLRPQQLHQLGPAARSSSPRSTSRSRSTATSGMGWSVVSEELGEFIEILPPQKRVGEHWYLGTADAVYQNLYSIVRENAAPRHRPVRRPRLQDGLREDAAVPPGARTPTSRWRRSRCRSTTAAASASSRVDEHDRVVGLPGEAGAAAARCPDRRTWRWRRWASTSSTPTCWCKALEDDAADADSQHDFGKDIIPALIPHACRSTRTASTTRTRRPRSTGATSARSTPTTKPTWICARSIPSSTCTIPEWPLRTYQPQAPPAKFVFAEDGRRCGQALDSVISHGCIVSGSRVRGSILCPNVRVHSFCDDRAVDPDAGRARRPPRAHPPRDHRPRRARSRAAR